MERVAFALGPLTIYTFGIFIALGALAGMILVQCHAKRLNLNMDIILELVIVVIAAGVIGARLFFILFYQPAYYLNHPMEVFRIYEGGLSIHGGILGGILAGYLYTKKRGLNFWQTADLLVPGVILAQAIARIGCDVFGVPMQNPMPWGVLVSGQLLHPVQIYETILDLMLLLFLLGMKERRRYQGQLFVLYLAGYSLIRFLLEFVRENPLLIGSFTPAHITSAVFLASAILIGKWLSKEYPIEPINNASYLWVRPSQWALVCLIAVVSIAVFYSFV